MTKKKSLIIHHFFRSFFWLSYFGIIATHTLYRSHQFFTDASGLPFFYRIIYYFYPLYLVKYLIDFFQVILAVVHLLPLAFFILNIRVGTKKFWQTLFIAHVVLDILGNTFAKIQIKSLYYEHQMYFWIVIAAILVIYAPAYYGTYRYAYQE